MKTSKTIGQPLPPEYYQAIGQILVNWSWLEFRVQEAIWHLLPKKMNRKASRAITSQVDVRGLTNALAALAPHRIDNKVVAAKVVGIARAINVKANARNDFVHGAWEWDATSRRAAVRVYRNHHSAGRSVPYDLKALEEFNEEIERYRSSLLALLDH